MLPVMDTLPSRETVYVKGVFMGLDTLHCFVVHWPSKLGGRESLQNRMAASDCLKKITDSILCADSRANIIVMGDFNDSPDSKPVANLDNLVNMSTMQQQNARNAMRRQVQLAQWPAPRLAPHKWCTY
jgi:endonuclease/exonuclease/phosphatase family metal-dependent hydrolase